MESLTPLDVTPLLLPLHKELMWCLRQLDEADWERPTVAGAWQVRDVVAHLLDGDLRKLSVYRDGHVLRVGGPAPDYVARTAMLNAFNDEWIRASKRLSTRVLIELLEYSGPHVAELLASLPPEGRSIFSVAWAGEEESANWMDAGREYTERWHHQMQVRSAVGMPMLLTPPWIHPLLDFSVRVLPVAYRQLQRPRGTAVMLEVDGPMAGHAWSLVREDGWTVMRGAHPSPATVLRLSADSAWRIFYNALPPDRARALLTVEGDEALVAPFLRARSVMV